MKSNSKHMLKSLAYRSQSIAPTSPQTLPFIQCRGTWSSQLFSGGAEPLVKMLKITPKEFREMCDRVERGKKDPKHYFDADRNVHLLPNLKLFKSWGLEEGHQKMVVRRYPAIISRNSQVLEDARKTYVDKLKLTGMDWRGVVITCPRLLTQSREQKFGQLYTGFRKGGFSYDEIRELFISSPTVFCTGVVDLMDQRLAVLKDLGLENASALHVIGSCPEVMCKNISENLKPKLRWFQKEMGLSWDPVIQCLLLKDPSLFWEAKIPDIKGVYGWLKGKGLTKEECRKVALTMPQVILHHKFGELPGMLAMIRS